MSIDDLLNQSLPPVADDGFSHRVVERMRAEERRHWLTVAALAVACAVVAWVALPMPELVLRMNVVLTHTTNSLAGAIVASSTAVGLAAGAIVVSLLLERQVSRR